MYYSHALLTALPRLDTLRGEACLKWALRAQSNPKDSDQFPLNQSSVNTRFRNKFKEYFFYSAKFYASAIPSKTRALNKFHANKTSQDSSLKGKLLISSVEQVILIHVH